MYNNISFRETYIIGCRYRKYYCLTINNKKRKYRVHLIANDISEIIYIY